LTALKARSLPLSRWAFGYAFLEVCLHPAKARFFALKHALPNSVTVPSTAILLAPLREKPIYRRSLQEKSAFKTHS
jgi:hypothetical protein